MGNVSADDLDVRLYRLRQRADMELIYEVSARLNGNDDGVRQHRRKREELLRQIRQLEEQE